MCSYGYRRNDDDQAFDLGSLRQDSEFLKVKPLRLGYALR